jgi:hypothetical protein
MDLLRPDSAAADEQPAVASAAAPAGKFAAAPPVFTVNLPFCFIDICEAAARASNSFEDIVEDFLWWSAPFIVDWSAVPLALFGGSPPPRDAISATSFVPVAAKVGVLLVFTRNLPFFLAQGSFASGFVSAGAEVLSLWFSLP